MRHAPRMRLLLRSLPVFAWFALVFAPASRAEDMKLDPVGHWQGTLLDRLRLVFHIERTASGALAGSMDSPDQGATGLRADSAAFSGDSLHLVFRRIGGGFAGRLNATGDTLRGLWSQRGSSLPLTLARTTGTAGPARSQRVAPPYPYDTVAVSIVNPSAAGIRLVGTLTLPRGKGPFPAAVLITGSGGQDRDETILGHHPFRVLADHLTRRGIAVLRLDDRGAGASTGSQKGATSEDFAGDILAGVDWLVENRADIARDRIGLIGHSEGGLIASLVTRRREDIAFVVMLAGPGLRGDSLMVLQYMAGRRSLATQEQLQQELLVVKRAQAATRVGDSAAVHREMRNLVEAQLAHSRDPETASADPETLVKMAMGRWWSPWFRYFLAYDPAPDLRRIRCPVLALNGERDVQVVAKENLAGIEAALRAGGNKDFTVRALPGLNHLFQTCRTCLFGEYGSLEETFAPSALEIVSTWIRQRTGLAKR